RWARGRLERECRGRTTLGQYLVTLFAKVHVKLRRADLAYLLGSIAIDLHRLTRIAGVPHGERIGPGTQVLQGVVPAAHAAQAGHTALAGRGDQIRTPWPQRIARDDQGWCVRI